MIKEEMKYSILQGSSLHSESKQFKTALESLSNWPDSWVHLSPRTHKQYGVLRTCSECWVVRKCLRSTKAPGKNIPNLLSCLQAIQCTAGFQLCELPPILRWTLVMQLLLSHFCICKRPYTHIPVSNHHKTHWLPKLDSDGICRFWYIIGSLSGLSRFFSHLPKNSVMKQKVKMESLPIRGDNAPTRYHRITKSPVIGMGFLSWSCWPCGIIYPQTLQTIISRICYALKLDGKTIELKTLLEI